MANNMNDLKDKTISQGHKFRLNAWIIKFKVQQTYLKTSQRKVRNMTKTDKDLTLTYGPASNYNLDNPINEGLADTRQMVNSEPLSENATTVTNQQANNPSQTQFHTDQKSLQKTMAPDIQQLIMQTYLQPSLSEQTQNQPHSIQRFTVASSSDSESSSIFQTEIYKQLNGNYEKIYRQKTSKLSLQPLTQQEIQQYSNKLIRHRIQIRQFQNIGNQVLVKNVVKQGNLIIQCKLQLGIYVLQISVFNFLEASYVPKRQTNKKTPIKEKKYLFNDQTSEKFIQIPICKGGKFNQESVKQVFLRTLKEVAILKIMSALEIGPQFQKPLGFDLIRYSNGFCFNMETCIKIAPKQPSNGQKCNQQVFKIINQKDIHDLKTALTVMHTFKITHADIKEDNIMYSPNLKKSVFIDFGISTIVQQKTTESTLIEGVFGTLGALGQEMLQIYIHSKKICKNRYLSLTNLYLGDIDSFVIFQNICQAKYILTEIQGRFKRQKQAEASQETSQQKHINIKKQMTLYFSKFKDEFQQKLDENKPPYKKLNFDKITAKFSGYEEHQMLWIRFYSYFFKGDMEKLKQQIMFFIDWQQYKNEALMPKDHILAVLNSQMQKALNAVEKSFYYSDLSVSTINFFKWAEEISLKKGLDFGLNANKVIRALDNRVSEMADRLIFGFKKSMTPDLLAEDFQNGFISLTQTVISKDKSKGQPNFRQILYQFLTLQKLRTNQIYASMFKENSDERCHIEYLEGLKIKQIVQKYVYFMGFRKRLGSASLYDRKKIANFLIHKFTQTYRIDQETIQKKCQFNEYFNHIRSYFKDLMTDYKDFESILESYLKILEWLYSDKYKKELVDQKNPQDKYKIQTILEIFHNLALAGYFNEQMFIEITEQIMISYIEASQTKKQTIKLFEILNLLLKFREIKQIANLNCLVFYDIKRYNQQTSKTQISCKYQSINHFEYWILQGAYKHYNTSKNQSKIQDKKSLEQRAIQCYLNFLKDQHQGNISHYSVIGRQVKEMMEENPHEMIQMYKIVRLMHLYAAKSLNIQRQQQVFNQCQLYNNYHKQESLPNWLLKKMYPSKVQRDKINAQYKNSYFQPEMLLVFGYLTLFQKTTSAYEYQFYKRMDQIIWIEQLCYQGCIFGRLYQLDLLAWISVSGTRKFNPLQPGILKKFSQTLQRCVKQRTFMKEKKDFFSLTNIKKIIKLIERMRQNWLQCIINKLNYQFKHFLEKLESLFDQIITDSNQIVIKNLNLRSKNIAEDICYILRVAEDLIVQKTNSQEQIADFVQTNCSHLLITEEGRPQKIKKHLQAINREICIKIEEQIISNLTTKQSQSKNQDQMDLILISLVMIELRIRLKTKSLDELNLKTMLLEKEIIDKKVKKLYQNCLKDGFFKNNFETYFYVYIIDTIALFRSTVWSIISESIRQQKQNNLKQNDKQNMPPKQDGQKQQLQPQKTNNIIFLQEKLKQIQNSNLYNLNDDLNKLIANLYQKYRNKAHEFHIDAQYTSLCQQICRLFTCQIQKLKSNAKQEKFLVIKNPKITQDKKIKRKNQILINLNQQKESIFRNMYDFLVSLYSSIRFVYGNSHQGRISHICIQAFNQMNLYDLFQFFDCFYDKWFKVKVDSSSLDRANCDEKTSQQKKTLRMMMNKAFSLFNRHLPVFLSLCNNVSFRKYERQIQKVKNTSEYFVIDLYHRNYMNKNMTFLRNICLRKKHYYNSNLEQPILFCRKIQDDGLAPDNFELTEKISLKRQKSQNIFSLKPHRSQSILDFKLRRSKSVDLLKISISKRSNKGSISAKKSIIDSEIKIINLKQEDLSPENIRQNLQKTINKGYDQAKIRQVAASVLHKMKSYFLNVCSCKQDDIKGSEIESIVTKIHKFLQEIQETNLSIETDQRLLQMVEYMNFYTVLTKEYKQFNKFAKLSDKLNRMMLLVEMNSWSLKKGQETKEFIKNLRKDKRKRNLWYDMKIFDKMEKIARQSIENEIENAPQGQNQSEKYHRVLVRKVRCYKAAYTGHLLKNLGVVKRNDMAN